MRILINCAVFTMFFILILKVLDSRFSSFEDSLKGDTKSMIKNNGELKLYLKKYWLLLLISFFLSALMSYLVLTYIKLVLIVIIALIVFVFTNISRQEEEYNKHNEVSKEIVVKTTAETMKLLDDNRIYYIKDKTVKRDSKVLIYLYEIESALFFSEEGRTEFMYSFEKRMREESLKAIYTDKMVQSKLMYYIEENGYSELLVTVAMCLNEETREHFDEFYKAKKDSHKMINVRDEDF